MAQGQREATDIATVVTDPLDMLAHDCAQPTPPTRVVVVGGSGVIGRATTALLRAESVEVLSLASRDIDLLQPDADQRLATMLRPEDALVVLAALTPDRGRDEATFARNIRMASAICGAVAACPVAHVIYMSSDAVYPRDIGCVTESSPVEASEPYAAMHLHRERMFASAIDAPLAILRATQVAAPNDPHDAYGPNRFRRTAAQEGRIVLFGHGEETRDHIVVDDVAAILRLCLMHRSQGLMNVATGRSLSFAEVAHIVADGFDPPPQIVCQPRKMPITHRRFDVSVFTQAFPDFVFTSLETGELNFRRVIAHSAPA